ncbi:MAG: hypothetical protein LCI00_28050 [Chloroflexi bacterium]|nr:hypothetical protein [Chloroflexota bacterium]MCC6893900.1 hypothetical protein [Anaerolineae bacterium]
MSKLNPRQADGGGQLVAVVVGDVFHADWYFFTIPDGPLTLPVNRVYVPLDWNW